jgi:hypothetical protein
VGQQRIEGLRAAIDTLWRPDQIHYFEASAASGFGLDGEALRLLAEAGLPRQVEFLFETAPLALSPSSRKGRDAVCFGTDGEASMCIDLASGEIVAMSRSQQFPSRFVNSSLAQFIAFLTAVVAVRRTLVDLSEEEAQTEVRALVETLYRIDPAALDDRDHWWAVIVEQMYDGLL